MAQVTGRLATIIWKQHGHAFVSERQSFVIELLPNGLWLQRCRQCGTERTFTNVDAAQTECEIAKALHGGY